MNRYSAFADAARQFGCECSENELMSRHTTFAIGGPADIFVDVLSVEKLSELVRIARETLTPVLVIGNGSNLLVSDEGIEGAVLHLSGLSEIKLIDEYTIECGAAVKLSKLCSFAYDNSLTGLEFAWGIPGTVGGTTYMNAGAYDSCMSEVVVSCNHVSVDGSLGLKEKNELEFGYRTSSYKKSGEIITSVKLRLAHGDQAQIREKMDELMLRRKSKQPLEYPSAGSVFKRPEGYFAGALIQECGLKGYSIGGAEVSVKHSGFIINKGGATCKDVLSLIDYIQNEVLKKFQVKLETEIAIVGEF